MKSYGICPASCGEFVQGILDNEEYLSSYAIDMFSIASLEEKKEDINLGSKKSRKAIEKVASQTVSDSTNYYSEEEKQSLMEFLNNLT